MLLLTALLLLALGFYLGTRAQRAEHAPLAFAPGIRRIEIHLPAGRLKVRGGPHAEISGTRTLRFLLKAPTVSERVEGDCLHLVGAPVGIQERGGYADYELQVPSSLAIRARTTAGSLDVAGMEGDVELQTVAGSIRVADLTGNLDLRTSAGSVEGRGLKSKQVEAYGSAGSIELVFSEAPDKVRVENHAGGVMIQVPGGPYNVHASTEFGHFRMNVPHDAAATARIDARTSMGSIDIRQPPVPVAPAD